MIGMIILAVLAVLIFFGLADKYFVKMNVAGWVAFLILLAFAVAAVFPPLVLGNVSISYAGFVLPIMLGVVTLFAIGWNSALLRTVVSALAVSGIVLAARVAFAPISYNAAIPSVLIVGFAAGIVSYIIGQSRLSSFSSVLCGIVLGDFITAMIFRFVFGSGYYFALGQYGIFDSIVLASVVGAVTLEIASLIIKAVERNTVISNTSASRVAVNIEAAEDNDFERDKEFLPIGDADSLVPPDLEDDMYDEYFDDDV